MTAKGTLGPALVPAEPSNDVASPAALRLEGVGKVFCSNLWMASRYAVADLLIPSLRNGMTRAGAAARPGEFFALENIDLAIRSGEAVGVVGLHHSGKSTLAKVAGGLYPPDVGRVRFEGRRAMVNSVAAGMRPMITLGENAIFRAALYGCDQRWIDENLDTVFEFAGVQDQVDRPLFNIDPLLVKRLGQSIALHLDADVLVFDDALGFRDPKFRGRALDRLARQLRKRAALIVTRDREILSSFCGRVLVLHKGSVHFEGTAGGAAEALAALADAERRGDVQSDSGGRARRRTSDEDDVGDDDDLDDESAFEADVDELANAEPNRTSPGFDLVWIEIAGVRSTPDARAWYALLIGERTLFRIRIRAKVSQYCANLTMGLHTQGEWRPFAALNVAGPGPCRKNEEIEIAGNFVVPPLMKGLYGLTLRTSELQEAYSRTTALKLGIFVPQNARRAGDGLDFEGEAQIVEHTSPTTTEVDA